MKLFGKLNLNIKIKMFWNRDKYNQNARIKTLKLNLDPRINNTNKTVRKNNNFYK
jgi:hypothetical protein